MGMSDSKQKTAQTQTQSHNNATTANYGWQAHPGSPEINQLKNAKFLIDPTIPYRSANAREQLDRSFQNPLGGYTTPSMRDAIMRTGRRRIDQDESQANREGSFDLNRLNYARDAAVAGMTSPVLTQTGSTSSGTGTQTGNSTTTQSQSPWGTIASIGASVAPLSL